MLNVKDRQAHLVHQDITNPDLQVFELLRRILHALAYLHVLSVYFVLSDFVTFFFVFKLLVILVFSSK